MIGNDALDIAYLTLREKKQFLDEITPRYDVVMKNYYAAEGEYQRNLRSGVDIEGKLDTLSVAFMARINVEWDFLNAEEEFFAAKKKFDNLLHQGMRIEKLIMPYPKEKAELHGNATRPKQ